MPRIIDRRKSGRGEIVKIAPTFLDLQDANGVWWRRTVQTDGTFSTPTNMGKSKPTDSIGFKKS